MVNKIYVEFQVSQLENDAYQLDTDINKVKTKSKDCCKFQIFRASHDQLSESYSQSRYELIQLKTCVGRLQTKCIIMK